MSPLVVPENVAPMPLGRIKFNVKEEDFNFEVQRELKEGDLAKRKDSEKKEEEVWGEVDIDKGNFDFDKGGGAVKRKIEKKSQGVTSSQSEEVFNADGELKV